jgi:parallel beta helix pectate lyase-like protein
MAELTRLARFELLVTKDKSSTDKAQVPADATADFYKQGATVATAVTVTNYDVDVTIVVRDVGRIVVGDTLRKGLSSTPTVTVSAVLDRTTLVVYSDGNGSLVLAVGDRLIVTTDRPTVHKENTGVDAYSASQVTTDGSTGFLYPAHVRERFFDAAITGTGVARLMADQPAGVRYPIYNVRELGGDIQAVIDALPDEGGVVYLPAGAPYQLLTGLVVNTGNVTLVGDGLGTVIQAADGHINAFDLITVNRAYFRAYNLKLDCRGTSQSLTSGKCGVVINGYGVSGHTVLGCYFENVQIVGAPRYGLWMQDVIVFLAVNCEFEANKGHGARIEKTTTGAATTTRFVGCGFAQNDGKGVELSHCFGLTLLGCWFEGNKAGWDAGEGNAIDATSSGRLEILSCYFEDAATGISGTPDHRTHQFIWLNACFSAIVDGCWFQGLATNTVPHLRPLQAVRFENSAYSRLSNNAAEYMVDQFASFSGDSLECAELCNHDRTAPAPGITRLVLEGSGRVFSLSRGVVGLYQYDDAAARPAPTDVREGSLIWVHTPGGTNSNLQVSNGTNWKNIALS